MNILDQTKEFILKHQDNVPSIAVPPAELKNPDEIYNWINTQSRLPWLKLLKVNVPFNEMLSEARSLRHRFVNHREGSGTGWYSLCVHGISAEMTNASYVYGYDDDTAPYNWTDIKSECPVTVNFFQNQFHYDRYFRVRFMLLEPGGYIEPHKDSDNHRLGTINISLNNPKNCKLVTEHGTVPYDSGSLVFLNTSYNHAAYNDSNEDRYHMIIHGISQSTYWRDIVINSFLNQ